MLIKLGWTNIPFSYEYGEDTRIRVTNIAVKKEQDKNTLRVRVAWSINPNIIQNGGSYHDEFSYPLNDVEVSEE